MHWYLASAFEHGKMQTKQEKKRFNRNPKSNHILLLLLFLASEYTLDSGKQNTSIHISRHSIQSENITIICVIVNITQTYYDMHGVLHRFLIISLLTNVSQ